MTGESSSYRRILWATTVIGGATLGALLIGLARNKAVALIGGPAAVGLFGLFTSIVTMGASVAGLGLDTSAVRQLSQCPEGSPERAATQRAVWTLALPLALLGAAAVWLFRHPLADLSAGNASYSAAVGWLALGVAATVVGGCQMALLQSHGRVGDLARVRLWGSFFATAVAIAAVYRWGLWGIVVAVLAVPLMTALLAFWFGRNLPGADWRRLAGEKLGPRWRALAAIGLVVMASNALISFNELSLRAIVTNRLGLDSAGFYVAGHTIVWVNLSLILNAMAADYYPRLSKEADNDEAVTAILNQQLHVGLVLAAPVFAAVSIVAPIVLTILYTGSFAQSDFLLRLMLAAGVLRLSIWALGFVLLARRASQYLYAELAAACALPIAWLLVSSAGLPGAGVAVLLSAAISFFVYFWQVSRRHGIKVSRENLGFIALLFGFLLAIAILFEVNMVAGAAVGVAGTAALAWHTFRTLRSAISS